MERISDEVLAVASRHADRTIFTRFLPPRVVEEMPGQWRAYYRKWRAMTLENLDPRLVDLLPPLARLAPPAAIFDKRVYSPWVDGRLHSALARQGATTLIITGGETDVCVLATVLGGIDLGYRIILLEDAVCSGADETHDASLKLLGDRFSVQLELMSTDTFLSQAGT